MIALTDCVLGSVNVTGECAGGYYCPDGSHSPEQIPCPAGTYRNALQGGSIHDCWPCTSGYYCPLGTDNPIVCPTGHYCIEGESFPQPCPLGTYSKYVGVERAENCTACSPKYYCDNIGLSYPTGFCGM